MPEKAGNGAKNDVSSPVPAAGGQASARQRKAPGLHKRVLSAAHSLVRGTRTSKSASGGNIRRNNFIPAGRRPNSAPGRKPSSQLRALHPTPRAYTKARRNAPAPKHPLKSVKLHPVEELDYHQDADALPFEEDPPGFDFQKEASLPENNTQQQPQKASSGLVDEALEELKTPKNTIDELDNEKELKGAIPDTFHAVLKASLRKVALHCNHLEENQVETQGWENIAQLLTQKLLGNNLDPHLPTAANTAQAEEARERDEPPTLSSPFSPSLSLPPPNEYYILQENQDQQHQHQHQQQQQRFKWEDKADAFMSFPLFSDKRSEEHLAPYRQPDTRENDASDSSSPLLSLNSADFDFSR